MNYSERITKNQIKYAHESSIHSTTASLNNGDFEDGISTKSPVQPESEING